MKTKTIGVGLVLFAALFILGCSGMDNNTATETDVREEVFEVPLAQINNEVQKFNYETKSATVTFFAVKGSDGEVRTAFDACDVCGGAKGYSQKGNDIECNNCGRVFSIDGLGTKNKGYGCWPSYLSHEIKDDKVVIKTTELEAGAFRFV